MGKRSAENYAEDTGGPGVRWEGAPALELRTSVVLTFCGELRACQQLISHPVNRAFLVSGGDPELPGAAPW